MTMLRVYGILLHKITAENAPGASGYALSNIDHRSGQNGTNIKVKSVYAMG